MPDMTAAEALDELTRRSIAWDTLCAAYGHHPGTTTAEEIIAHFDKIDEELERLRKPDDRKDD